MTKFTVKSFEECCELAKAHDLGTDEIVAAHLIMRIVYEHGFPMASPRASRIFAFISAMLEHERSEK